MSDESETIFGLNVEPMDEGYIPLEAICIIKALDDGGEPTLVVRHAGEINDWERVGMLSAALDVAKDQTVASWRPDSSDEDEDDGDPS
jgi:hypothetical protein